MKKQINKTEKLHYEYLIKVLSSAINQKTPPMPSKDINFEYMISIAESCGVEAIFANTVLNLEDKTKISATILKKLESIKNKQLLIDSVREFEIEKVLKFFDENKVRNLPLKGYYLKNEYPRSDFRATCDYDILFDEKDIHTVKEVFDCLGYKFIKNDDTQYHFTKKPYMYIEMHSSLVHRNNRHYTLLKNQLNHSIKSKNYKYSYNMSCEDFYVFLIVHSSNHFKSGGMGIRMLLDIYVYTNNHTNDFDYTYLNNRLSQLKLDKFEKSIKQIAYNWFSPNSSAIQFNDIETYILLSATLGRLSVSVMVESENSISKSNKNNNKFIHLLSSVFIPRNNLKYTYSYLEKFPFLLPVAWVSFWFNRIFVNKDVNIKRGLQNRLSYTKDDVSYFNKLLDSLGLQNN